MVASDPDTDALRRDLAVFFDLAAAAAVTAAEQAVLLDLPAADLAALRSQPPDTRPVDGAKLGRRVAYAIPILRRMLAAMTPGR